MSDKTPSERVAAKERESEACDSKMHAHYGWKCAHQLADELSAALQRAEKAEAELSRYREAEKALPDIPATILYLDTLRRQGVPLNNGEDYAITYIDSLRAYAAALQAERDALREDAERIGWLENNLVVIRDIGWVEKHDLRKAIDAARKETP